MVLIILIGIAIFLGFKLLAFVGNTVLGIIGRCGNVMDFLCGVGGVVGAILLVFLSFYVRYLILF